ncbi:choice-of-anchor D domain-containing protein [Winogradskyella ludwigii]|uniref:choice-of-anchor D domain-containing protein n=1 Tax=Winogradskyella ludwigii TaxID=2686076 RepID=UPI0015CE6603|nr:choice-of-anchor D domain-containing protein [Winogradskyella ludwigii]
MVKNYALSLIAFLCFVLSGYGQEIFNVAGGGTFPAGWTDTDNTGLPIAQSGYYLIEPASTGDVIETASYDLSANTSATFEVDIRSYGAGSHRAVLVEVSTDGGTTFTQSYTTPNTTTSYITRTINIATVSANTVLRLSVNATSGRGIRMQDLILTGIGASSTDTELDFASATYSANEGGSSINLCVDITNPSATPTTAQVVLTSGTAPHLSYTTQNITFPASSSAQQCVTVAIANNTNCSDSTDYTFEIQNVAGGDSAAVGSDDETTLSITDDDGANGVLFSQGFETSGDTWLYSNTNGAPSTINTGTPSDRIKSGSRSFQRTNGNATINLDNGGSGIDISSITNVSFSLWNASISGSTGNGIDGGDNLKVYLSQTSTFSSTPDITIVGNSNARFGMSGTGVVSTTAGTPITYTYPSGGNLSGNNAKSNLIVDVPDTWNTLFVKVVSLNDATNEIWAIDDITLSGDSCSTVISDTNVAFNSTSSTLTEDGLFIDVCVAIANESATNATTVDITLDGASTATNGTDYDDGAGTPAAISFPQTLTFPAGNTADQCFTIFISNDDIDIESDETIILNLSNPTGGNAAIIGANTTHTVTITDNDFYDSCINALTIPVNSTCVNQSFTNVGATDSGVADPGCGGYQGGDVWFKLTVPSSGAVTLTTSENGGFTDSGMALYTGSCGSLSLVSCDDDSGEDNMSQISASGLTPGATVYVRVWEFFNNSFGTFNLCAYSASEIDVERNTFTSITNGNAANTGNNTIFAATEVGTATPPVKTYYIRNEGSADLDVPSITSSNATEFTIVTNPTPVTLAPGDLVAFEIEFNPSAIGTRNGTITIVNDDADENPYTFGVSGEGNCAAGSITISPSSGPVGTIVTITGTNLATATAAFNGVSATVTNISATEMQVTVPSGATSGTLEISDSLGCPASTPFNVINSQISSCEGNSGVVPTDLFISEITDATFGGLSYVELYNGTGLTINTDDYSIEVIANGDNTAAAINIFDLENYAIPNGSTYVIALGRQNPPTPTNACTSITGGSGELTTTTNAQFSSGGINKKSNEHDLIRLVKSGTTIDEFGVYQDSDWMDSTIITGDRGFNFRRSNTATQLPDPTFTLAELSNWTIIDWVGDGVSSCSGNDYSDIGLFSYSTGSPPSVTLQPADANFECEFAASFTISGMEGYDAGDDTQELAYQWYYNAPGTATWVEILAGNSDYSGQQSNMLSIANTETLNSYQYYCQLREDTATCFTASNAVKLDVRVSSWDGTNWDTATGLDRYIVIDGDYDTAELTNGETSFEACGCTITAGNELIISDNTYVKVKNNLIVDGSLIVNSSGSFVQVNDAATVTGNVLSDKTKIIVFKTTGYLNNRHEYVYWSTPVTGELVGDGLAEANPGRTYAYSGQNFLDKTRETSNDGSAVIGQDDIDDNGDDWVPALGPDVMATGYGYAAAQSVLGLFPGNATYTFEGPFNNGIYNIPIYRNDSETNDNNWNLIGNPYPSAIDADLFLDVNASETDPIIDGAIFFWSQATAASATENGNEGLNYAQDDYAIINGSGETMGGDLVMPDRAIPSGQAFFVSMDNGATASTVSTDIKRTDVVFNNSMRVTGSNTQFFRSGAADQPNKLWLNLTTDNGVTNQTLVAYVNGATDDYDGAYYDAKKNISTDINAILYSVIENAEVQNLAIQGKNPNSLTLDEVIPLGFVTGIEVPTLYSISIYQLEGTFMTENAVYVKDNVLNTTHNLKDSDYTFTSEAGEFNNRFEIVFETLTLSIEDSVIEATDLTITELQNGEVEFKVGKSQTITNVELFDALGRRIYTFKGNSATEVYNVSKLSQAAYIAKVTLASGQVISKKALKQH